MASECLAPIRARHLRLVKLDECGAPVTGAASAQVVTKGFTQVVLTPNYEVQGAIRVRNAQGELCVNEPDQTELIEVSAAITFCQIDPDALVILTGETLITGGPPVTGTGIWFGEGLITARYSLELWQPVAGAGACTPGGQQKFMYWALGNLGSSQIGAVTVQNGELTMEVTSLTKAIAAAWGNGPGGGASWVATPPGPLDHWGFNVTTTPPPDPPATCGAFPLA